MGHPALFHEIESDRSHVTTKTTTRHSISGIPSALQDSPYLSSPIRPLSFRSTTSRKSKRSVSRSFRAHSPARSTVGSLRLKSPYSESVFSLQSLSSTTSRGFNQKRQSLSRTVLLPHEIDDLQKLLGATICVMKNEKHSLDDDENEYDLSDFDDDSTVNSESVMSIDDAAVLHLLANDAEDTVLGNHRISMPSTASKVVNQPPCDDHSIENDNNVKEVKAIDPPNIKLPSVNADRGGDEKVSHRKKIRSEGKIDKKNRLFKSPYAATMKPKKSKKKREDRPKRNQ